MKDKSYRDFPLGAEATEYLRVKSKRLTPATQRDYESCLDKLARHFPELEVAAFEPPGGTTLIEDFMSARWGERAPRTYNKNLACIRDFFVWQVRRGRLHGDPTLTIERAKPRAIYRTTFSATQRAAIFAGAIDRRDRIALRLLLDYGIRKGALQGVQLLHLDTVRRRLVIVTKGGKVHKVPMPDDGLWSDLEQLLAEPGVQLQHYLLCKQKIVSRRGTAKTLTAALDEQLAEVTARARRLREAVVTADTDLAVTKLEEAAGLFERACATAERVVNRKPHLPMGEHGLHDWWYRCLARAGIVDAGVTHGERMHKARHTAGQRVLDKTGNLKAAQMLLGHADIGTTAAHYVGWDDDQLEATMREVLAE